MRSCTGCGHPNRPGVRFCTHCGRPAPASDATARRAPTSAVAVIVLAVGLLAFLTIQPIAPRRADDAPGRALVPVVASPDPVASPGPVASPDPAAVPAAAAAPDPVASTSEPRDLVLPAAAPLAMPTAPALSQGAASPPARPELRPRVRTPPARVTPPQPSSSPAKHAAVDPAPSPGTASLRSPQRAEWLVRLRAELDACEGDLIVRTICRETAKFRHCASADAWGRVPECPAARLPDLANFN